MRYKNPVAKNLESAKNTMDMTIRLLDNNNISIEDVKSNLARVLKFVNGAIDLVDKEEETR